MNIKVRNIKAMINEEEEVAHAYLHNFKEYLQKCKNPKRNVSGLAKIELTLSYFCRNGIYLLQNFDKLVFELRSLYISQEKSECKGISYNRD